MMNSSYNETSNMSQLTFSNRRKKFKFRGRSWYVVGVIFVTMFEIKDSTKLAFYILASRKIPRLLSCKASAGEHTKITWPDLLS